jgi:hypothetical protein
MLRNLRGSVSRLLRGGEDPGSLPPNAVGSGASPSANGLAQEPSSSNDGLENQVADDSLEGSDTSPVRDTETLVVGDLDSQSLAMLLGLAANSTPVAGTSPVGAAAVEARLLLARDVLQRVTAAKAVLTDSPTLEPATTAEGIQYLQHLQEVLHFCIESPEFFDPKEVAEDLDKFLAAQLVCTSWPIAPLPFEGAPPVGSWTYFEHPSEGCIKLMWTNPLPRPGMMNASYQCDVCNEDVQAAWQHVSEGEERDKSTFRPSRVGWDVCFSCQRLTVNTERAALTAAAVRAWQGSPSPIIHRSPAYTQHVIRIATVSAAEGGALAVTVEASLTGEYLLCLATPDPAIPDAWESAGVEALFNIASLAGAEAPTCCICLDSVLDTTDGRIRPITTKCGHHFHEQCLRKLLRGLHGVGGLRCCPLCRQADPLDVQATLGAPLTLRFILRHDAKGQPFRPETSYLIICLMAADKDKPLESHSCAAFTLYRHRPAG